MNDAEYKEKRRNLVQCCPIVFGGEEDYHFECHAGWFDILNGLLGDLEKIASGSKPDLRIGQIKEKFGALRVYISGAAEWVDGGAVLTEVGHCIANAVKASKRTCEFCGEPGELRDGRWLRTACELHYYKEQVRFLEMEVERLSSGSEEEEVKKMSKKKQITLLIEIADVDDPTENYSISAPEDELPDDEEMFILLHKLASDIKSDLGVEH